MVQQDTNKKQRRGRGRGRLGEFDAVDVESVCYASDEELFRHLHDLLAVREEGFAAGADTVPVEIEICYVRREIGQRKTRRDRHESYVRSLQEENAALETAVVFATPLEAN